MSEPRPAQQPISTTGVVAVILSVAALLILPVAVATHPIALVLAVAGALVGMLEVVNTRRAGRGLALLGVTAIALGIIAAVIVAFVALT